MEAYSRIIQNARESRPGEFDKTLPTILGEDGEKESATWGKNDSDLEDRELVQDQPETTNGQEGVGKNEVSGDHAAGETEISNLGGGENAEIPSG